MSHQSANTPPRPDYPRRGYKGFYKEHPGRWGSKEYTHQHRTHDIRVQVFLWNPKRDLWKASVSHGTQLVGNETFKSEQEALEQGVYLYAENFSTAPPRRNASVETDPVPRQAGENSLNEKNLITFLRKHPGGISVAELAYSFGGHPQQYTRFLRKLVDKGVLVKDRTTYRLKSAGEMRKLLTAADYENILSKTATSARSPWPEWWTETANGFTRAFAISILKILKVTTSVDDRKNFYVLTIPMIWEAQDANFTITLKVYVKDEAIIVRAQTNRGDLQFQNIDLGYYKIGGSQKVPLQLAAQVVKDFNAITRRIGYTPQ